MQSPRVFRIFCLSVMLFLVLCSSCQADSIVDKETVLQIPLADIVKDGQTPKVIAVHYKVLAADPEEASIVQIALMNNELRLRMKEATKEKEDLFNTNSIGLISHFPPARKGATGDVQLPIPLPIQKTASDYFIVFRMLPAHPEGRLEKSRIEVLSVALE